MPRRTLVQGLHMCSTLQRPVYWPIHIDVSVLGADAWATCVCMDQRKRGSEGPHAKLTLAVDAQHSCPVGLPEPDVPQALA